MFIFNRKKERAEKEGPLYGGNGGGSYNLIETEKEKKKQKRIQFRGSSVILHPQKSGE